MLHDQRNPNVLQSGRLLKTTGAQGLMAGVTLQCSLSFSGISHTRHTAAYSVRSHQPPISYGMLTQSRNTPMTSTLAAYTLAH